jgi:protein TonB
MLNQNILRLESVYSRVRRGQPIVLPPKASANRDVLSEAILDEITKPRRGRPLDLAVSLMLHVAVVTMLILVPFFFSAGLDLHNSVTTFLVAPLPPAAAPPPPPVVTNAPRTPPKQFLHAGQLAAPSFVPRKIAMVAYEAPPSDLQPVGGVIGGLAGTMPGGQADRLMDFGATSAPVAPKVASEPKKPVRMGSSLKPPQMIYSPTLEYPVLAKQAHISGTVVIDAIIDERGNVIEARAISGHALLVPAALKVVSQRKYEPTILDGEPTPIELTVEVNFHG